MVASSPSTRPPRLQMAICYSCFVSARAGKNGKEQLLRMNVKGFDSVHGSMQFLERFLKDIGGGIVGGTTSKERWNDFLDKHKKKVMDEKAPTTQISKPVKTGSASISAKEPAPPAEAAPPTQSTAKGKKTKKLKRRAPKSQAVDPEGSVDAKAGHVETNCKCFGDVLSVTVYKQNKATPYKMK